MQQGRGANPSLQGDPDKLFAGTAYLIPARSDLSPAAHAAAAIEALSEATAAQRKNDSSVLRYGARAGDTLITMAQAFLGSGSQENQDATVAANASLSTDPDRVVADRRLPRVDSGRGRLRRRVRRRGTRSGRG
jgi:hypothetical protein